MKDEKTPPPPLFSFDMFQVGRTGIPVDLAKSKKKDGRRKMKGQSNG